MKDHTVDATLAAAIIASGIPGLRLTPTMAARHLGIPHSQAARALRRLAYRGLLRNGRTA